MAWEPPSEDERARAEAALMEALGKEQEAAVRDRIVEALGKVGARGGAGAAGRGARGQRARAGGAGAGGAGEESRDHRRRGARAARGAARRRRRRDALGGGAGAFALSRFGEPCGAARLRQGRRRCTCARPAPRRSPTSGATKTPTCSRRSSPIEDARVAAEAARTLTKLAEKCADRGLPRAARAADQQLPWRPSVVQAVTFEHWRGMAAAARAARGLRRRGKRRAARRAHARHRRLQVGDGARSRERSGSSWCRHAAARASTSASAAYGAPRRSPTVAARRARRAGGEPARGGARGGRRRSRRGDDEEAARRQRRAGRGGGGRARREAGGWPMRRRRSWRRSGACAGPDADRGAAGAVVRGGGARS